MLSNEQAVLRDQLQALAKAGIPRDFRRFRFREAFPEHADLVSEIGRKEIVRMAWGAALVGKRSAEAAFLLGSGMIRAGVPTKVLFPSDVRDGLKTRTLGEALDEIGCVIIPYIGEQPFDRETQSDLYEAIRKFMHIGRRVILAFDVPPPKSGFGTEIATYIRSNFFVRETN